MRWHRLVVWLLIAAVLALWPLYVGSPYLVGVSITVLIYIALALSFDLVVGLTGLLSFAHPGFFGIGAYTAALLGLHLGSPFPLRLGAAVVTAVLASIIIGVPSFRLSYHSFAMGTLGFAFIAQIIALNWIPVTRGPLCLPGVPPVDLRMGSWTWSATTLSENYYVVLILATITLWIVVRVAHSRIGRTLMAIRDDETLAKAVGVPVLRYKMLAFVTGAGVAGALGSFFASYASAVCPTELGIAYSVNLIIILFLGGRGTIAGPILGAILFTGLPEFLRMAEAWRLVVYGLLIILASALVPEGIITWAFEMWQKRREGPQLGSAPLAN